MYALTPYLISNLYGRIDVAESIAHSELPFLALGVAMAMTRSARAGAAVIAVAMFCLALTYPTPPRQLRHRRGDLLIELWETRYEGLTAIWRNWG